MRDYVRNLDERMRQLGGESNDLLLECLAYAEGELLSIHPFPDLNGRISRLWLLELLRRLQLPLVDLVPPSESFRQTYFAALAAADRQDWRPLMHIWKQRLAQRLNVNEIALPGCTPTPLASYLKALAVLRLVAEDAEHGDPDATGFWHDDVFYLRTKLTQDQLRDFFLEHYRPTPLISPWNGRAGFLEGEDEDDTPNGEIDTDNSDEEGDGGRIGALMVSRFTSDALHLRFGPIKTAIRLFQNVKMLDQ